MKVNEKIGKILKTHGVKVAYLFGSQVKGVKTPLSDIDIGIVFKDIKVKDKDPAGVFTELYEAFKTYLKIKDQRLDLVYLQEAPFSLQMEAIKNGKVLYSESEEFRTDYEDYVMMRYMDWKYEDNLYNMEMIKAIYAGV